MKANQANSVNPPHKASRRLLPGGAFFLLGVLLTGIWFHKQPNNAVATAGLAAPTQRMLSELPAPVGIRFYSLLTENNDSASLRDFASRVSTLLDALQAGSAGKIQITRINTANEANRTAAGTDGLQAFNLDKGDACFLGLTIASGKNKEAFARLQPEWEPALEYDLARAISRVGAAAAPPKPAPEIAKPSPEIITSINRLIPDVAATPVATANQIFHDDFMKQCGEAGAEMEAQINAAQQKVVQAQENGSEAELEAAKKNLSEVQLAQADKVRQIAARLQIQMAVFQRMKSSVTNTVH